MLRRAGWASARAYTWVPQLETGKISCVRRPCYGRLSPRQRIENVLTAIKLLVTTLNRPLCEPILEPLISIKQFEVSQSPSSAGGSSV